MSILVKPMLVHIADLNASIVDVDGNKYLDVYAHHSLTH